MKTLQTNTYFKRKEKSTQNLNIHIEICNITIELYPSSHCLIEDNGSVTVKNVAAAVPPIRAESLLMAFTKGWPLPTDPDWPAAQKHRRKIKDRRRCRSEVRKERKDRTNAEEASHGNTKSDEKEKEELVSRWEEKKKERGARRSFVKWKIEMEKGTAERCSTET